jgi:uncharacterized membrane protein YuzA (DUF378 family)
MKMSVMDWVVMVLVVVGGLNWGLVGLLDFDLVVYLLGDMTMLTRGVYTLVGLAALWMLAMSLTKSEM